MGLRRVATGRPRADQRVQHVVGRRAPRRPNEIFDVAEDGLEAARRSSRPAAVLLLARIGAPARTVKLSSGHISKRRAWWCGVIERVDLLDLGQDVEELSRDLLAAGEGRSLRRPPRNWRRRARSAPAPGRPSCAGPRAGGAPRRRSAAGRSPPGRSGCRWRPPPACPPRCGAKCRARSSMSSSRSGPLAASGTVARTQPPGQPSSPPTTGSVRTPGTRAQSSRAWLIPSAGARVTVRPISSSASAPASAAASPSRSA